MIKPCYGKCDYCGATQIDREALLHDIEQSVVYTAREKMTSAEMRGAHKIIERIKCAPAVEPIYIHEPTKSEFKRMAVQMGYVQVVRCKDCKYLVSVNANGKGIPTCQLSGMKVASDEFCRRGEKVRTDNG